MAIKISVKIGINLEFDHFDIWSNSMYMKHSSLQKRVIAWDLTKRASVDGIIWGDAMVNKHGGMWSRM